MFEIFLFLSFSICLEGDLSCLNQSSLFPRYFLLDRRRRREKKGSYFYSLHFFDDLKLSKKDEEEGDSIVTSLVHFHIFFSFRKMFLEHARTTAILCLTVFGCTGNLLTFIVVNQPFFRKTTSASSISALCIADCMVLCLQSFQIVSKLQPHVTSYDCVLFFFIDVFRLLSVWIVCFIIVERCSLVFNPCHLPRLTSRTKSHVAMFILFLISLLIFSHYARHTHIQYVYPVNQTIPIRSFCAFKPNFDRLTWGCVRSGLTYWSVVPLCIICNLIIVQRLRQASRIERKLNENTNNNHLPIRSSIQSNHKFDLSSKQRQLTAMLVASSIGFVLTATPSTIHATYLLITNKLNNFHYVIHIVTNILLHFHHASNFLAFSLSGTRFRIELLHFFRRYFRCQMYMNWYKRSIPATEQHLLNSTKQQKVQVKLLSSKTRGLNQQPTPQRTIQPFCHNGVVPRTRDYYRRNTGPSVLQPFL